MSKSWLLAASGSLTAQPSSPMRRDFIGLFHKYPALARSIWCDTGIAAYLAYQRICLWLYFPSRASFYCQMLF